MKKSVIILILLLSCLPLFPQSGTTLKGKITSATTKEPVFMAAVVIKELNIWSVTSDSGEYTLKNVPAGTYTLVVSCLGFVQNEQAITFPFQGETLDIAISESTLALDEVVVVAQEGKRMASSSVIQQSAIQHVQPTDLSDIMQLLPGQVTQNPNLSNPKQLSIREINPGTDNMASLGTLLIVDGAPVSNDANMQFLKTTSASTGVTAGFATTASGGTDVRQISVDNIESIEVIRGIAGVENGDMLNGAVKVTMKKGKTPFTAKIKIDPGIKQFTAGKGFELPKDKGSLNVDFDFTRSFDDIRVKYKTFNRLSGGVAWSNTFMQESKPLTLNLSTRMTQTIDLNKLDPDMLDVEEYEANEKGVSVNMNGKWALNSKAITNLNFMLSGNFQHQVGHEIDLVQIPSGAQPQPVAIVAGENEVPFLPSSYISDLTIDGKPYYIDAKISANKSAKLGALLNNIVGGVDWKLYGNNGLGRVYDLSRPPTPTSGTDARPRSYKDIPSLGQLALYAEENLTIPVGKTRFDLQAGIRFTNVQPEGLFTSKEKTTMLDPRVNLKYTLIDDKTRAVSKLTLRSGYGYFSKAPSLLYLYPDKAYWDKPGMNYYDASAYDGYFIVTTKIFENPRNENLKPALNKKMEAGIDLTFKKVNLTLTAFKESMENGFSFQSYYENFIFNKYTQPSQNGLADYFYFVPGEGVYYNDPNTGDVIKLPVTQDTVFVSFSYPANDQKVEKKGVEFTLDLGTINALRTSFIVDGAYLYVKKQSTLTTLTRPSTGTIGGKEFPYVAVYPGGDGDIDERFSTNIRTITHIKELRMVITLNAQIIWIDRNRNIYEDGDGNPLFYTTTPVENLYDDILYNKYLNPTGYYDRKMVYHTFDPSLATTRPYADLIKAYNTPWYFARTWVSPYYQINIKLTKEITDKIDFSFYANNFTNHDPLLKIRGGAPESYARKNTSLYFGAELKIKLN